ncbi:right-handed parallel beta-helix repeat-containing protein [Candidatus Woesearchaeota archaeon]|nr:right-handed parallel beta-helix repeat-containing protein [Candidatus Woesearchaeota archaeon]
MRKKRGVRNRTIAKKTVANSSPNGLFSNKTLLFSTLIIIVIGTVLIFAYKPLKETYGKAVALSQPTPILSPGEIGSCGVLQQEGTYTLTQDIILLDESNLGSYDNKQNNVCFRILSDNVILDGGGFKIQGVSPLTYNGIAVQVGSVPARIDGKQVTSINYNTGVTIKNFGLVANFSKAIIAYNSENLNVEDNILKIPPGQGTAPVIGLSYSKNVNIKRNTVLAHEGATAVDVSGDELLSENIVIENNNIVGSVVISPGVSGIGANIFGNNITGWNGITVMYNNKDLTISGNNIYSLGVNGGSGVRVTSSKNVKVLSNNIIDVSYNSGYDTNSIGVHVALNSTDNVIQGNTIHNFTQSIRVDGDSAYGSIQNVIPARNTLISENNIKISEPTGAIYLFWANNTIMQDNNITREVDTETTLLWHYYEYYPSFFSIINSQGTLFRGVNDVKTNLGRSSIDISSVYSLIEHYNVTIEGSLLLNGAPVIYYYAPGEDVNIQGVSQDNGVIQESSVIYVIGAKNAVINGVRAVEGIKFLGVENAQVSKSSTNGEISALPIYKNFGGIYAEGIMLSDSISITDTDIKSSETRGLFTQGSGISLNGVKNVVIKDTDINVSEEAYYGGIFYWDALEIVNTPDGGSKIISHTLESANIEGVKLLVGEETSGIYISASDASTTKINNTFIGSNDNDKNIYVGIQYSGAGERISILGTKILNSDYGLLVEPSYNFDSGIQSAIQSLNVQNTEIIGGYYGIFLGNSKNIFIEDSVIDVKDTGISTYSQTGGFLNLKNNSIKIPEEYPTNGVSLYGAYENLEIVDNRITAGSGVSIYPYADFISYGDHFNLVNNYTKKLLMEKNTITSNLNYGYGASINSESSVIRNNVITAGGESSWGILITDPASKEFQEKNDVSMNTVVLNGNGLLEFGYGFTESTDNGYTPITKVHGSAGITMTGGNLVVGSEIYHNYPESESWNVEKNSIVLKGEGVRGIVSLNTLGAVLKENNILSEGLSDVLIGARLTQNMTLENNNLESRGGKSAGILLISSKNVQSTNDVIKTLDDGNSTILLVDQYDRATSTLSYTNTSVDEKTITVSDEEVWSSPQIGSGDSWTFLPEYQPGEDVNEGVAETMPIINPEPVPPSGGAITEVVDTTDYGFPVNPTPQKSKLLMNRYAKFVLKNGNIKLSDTPISMYSSNGELLLATQTDSEGKTQLVKINEYWHNGSQRIYETPHTINIATGDSVKSVVFNISEWNSGIYLIDISEEPVSIERFLEASGENGTSDDGRKVSINLNLEKSVVSRIVTNYSTIIDIIPKETIGKTQVFVTVHDNNTKIITPSESESLKKTVDITVTDIVNNNIETALIIINYTDAEIQSLDVNESTLKIWKWNETAGSWIALHNSGVDTIANFVWANLSSFSTYGVFGNKNVQEQTQTPTQPPTSDGGSTVSSGSSGSGGGGAGGGGGGGGSYGGSVAKKSVVTNNDTPVATINKTVTQTKPLVEKFAEKNATQPVQESPAQTPEEKSGVQTRILLIGALAGIVLLFVAWKFYLSPVAKLRRSIKKNISAGYSKKDIIKTYVQKGWSEEIIRKASNT